MSNELAIVSVEIYPEEKDDAGYPMEGYTIERLSNGWYWHQYHDGSGGLHVDEKTHYFLYDKWPYHTQDGIEYTDLNNEWTVYWGTFDEFKRAMEQKLLKYLEK